MEKFYQVHMCSCEDSQNPFSGPADVFASTMDEEKANKICDLINNVKTEEGTQKYYAFIRTVVMESFDLINADIAEVSDKIESLGLMGW